MKDYVPFNFAYWLNSKKHSALPSIENISDNSTFSIDDVLVPEVGEKPPEDEEDILKHVIGEKEVFLKGSIQHLKLFQHERKQINKRNIYLIEYKTMYFKNLIFELEFWPMGRHPGTNMLVEKRRTELEKFIFTLEQEIRREETMCWNDLLKVTRDMRDLKKESMELKIRKRIIWDDRK